jgi:four helix bundle protein
MAFGHEQLDVYQISIHYVSWAYNLAKRLTGVDRHARDQLLRASQSIALNIAEGNGKGSDADRRRFFEIARGSALECAAIQDCLAACDVLIDDENHKGKAMLVRIVSMLTKLGRYKSRMREDPALYGHCDYDNDYEEKPRHEIPPGVHDQR